MLITSTPGGGSYRPTESKLATATVAEQVESEILPSDGVELSRASRASDPTKAEWDRLIAGGEDDGYPVLPGRRSSEPVPGTMDEVRAIVDSLSFHGIDPFVATVAAAVSAGMTKLPRGEFGVHVPVPGFYNKPAKVRMSTRNGPEAPMMVILPGIHGSGEGSHTDSFKKMALERGMNYVVIPNSLSSDALDWEPVNHPGNPRVDAKATHTLLKELQSKYPDHFRQVSVGGYSYGALHGANLVRFEEESQRDPSKRLINGSLVGVSPPENLEHSMKELDGLRELYAEGAGSIIGTGLSYRNQVRRHGYENFMRSDLSGRGPGQNITEIKISDKYGSRDGMESLVDRVDRQFGHDILPVNSPEYPDASRAEKRRMRQEHEQQIEDMTYARFSDDWMSKDKWLKDRRMTPEQMAERYKFTTAMKAIKDTPVMMFGSADDYILTDRNVQDIRALERRPAKNHVVKTFDTGGHVGVLWNPEVQNVLADFAYAPPSAKASA